MGGKFVPGVDSDHKPCPDKLVWCPMCDWNQVDTMSGRKRMGLHLADKHYDEIVFEKGTEPPDFIEEPALNGRKLK